MVVYQGPGLKNIVTIARYAGKKASLDIRRAVPLFVFLMMSKWFQETLVGSLRGE